MTKTRTLLLAGSMLSAVSAWSLPATAREPSGALVVAQQDTTQQTPQERRQQRQEQKSQRQQQRQEQKTQRQEQKQQRQEHKAQQPQQQQQRAQQHQPQQKPQQPAQAQSQPQHPQQQQRQEQRQQRQTQQQQQREQRQQQRAQEKQQQQQRAQQQRQQQEHQKQQSQEQQRRQQQEHQKQQSQEQQRRQEQHQQQQSEQQQRQQQHRAQQQRENARDRQEQQQRNAQQQRAQQQRNAQEHARRVEDLRKERKETKEGNRTIIHEGNRTIVRENNRTIIRHDDADRFRIGAHGVKVVRQGAEVRTVVTRPGGVEIINVRDNNGRLLRRIRRDKSGHEVVIIDNRRVAGPAGFIVQLPPPVIRIPQDRYIVDAAAAPPALLYQTLEAPPVEPVAHAYTLDQVRYNHNLRARMPRVDLDAITFDTGSWEVTPDQAAHLAPIAHAMQQAIAKNNAEVFLVEGHTDAVGDPTDNLSLSDRRAEAVAVVLTQQYGIPPENLVTQGYGEQNLKVQTQGPERRNRRVSIRRITPLLAGKS